MRVDTYQKLLLPETFFGWLNVTPWVGGRYTYYGAATGPGATTGEVNRWVFDTGVELSTKASRLWPDVESKFLGDGWPAPYCTAYRSLTPTCPRRIAYGTNVIPQFDYQLPSLRLLPITFPEYNSIDSIEPRERPPVRPEQQAANQARRPGRQLRELGRLCRLEPAPTYQPDNILGPLLRPDDQAALVDYAGIADALRAGRRPVAHVADDTDPAAHPGSQSGRSASSTFGPI